MFGRKKKSRIIDAVIPNFSDFTEEELADMRRCFTGEITEEDLEKSRKEDEIEEEHDYWLLKRYAETGKYDDGSVISQSSMVMFKESYAFYCENRVESGKPV